MSPDLQRRALAWFKTRCDASYAQEQHLTTNEQRGQHRAALHAEYVAWVHNEAKRDAAVAARPATMRCPECQATRPKEEFPEKDATCAAPGCGRTAGCEDCWTDIGSFCGGSCERFFCEGCAPVEPCDACGELFCADCGNFKPGKGGAKQCGDCQPWYTHGRPATDFCAHCGSARSAAAFCEGCGSRVCEQCPMFSCASCGENAYCEQCYSGEGFCEHCEEETGELFCEDCCECDADGHDSD